MVKIEPPAIVVFFFAAIVLTYMWEFMWPYAILAWIVFVLLLIKELAN